jgi:uncharacterized Zn-binding protein involved in type VI secretion
MFFAARVGDFVGGAGEDDVTAAPILLPAHLTVVINGKYAAMPGSVVTPHGLPPHNKSVLTAVKPRTVNINGVFARAVGDTSTCGHLIVTGAPTVFITP